MLTKLLLLAIACAAISAPTNDFVLHEKRSSPNAQVRKRVEKNAILPIRIGLSQSNLDSGYDYLLAVSDPQSHHYGRYWTTEELHSKFAPSDDTIRIVTSWLRDDHGFSSDQLASSASKGWLALDMSVEDAERLFSTRYYEHTDEDGNVGVICDEYYLPRHLSEHIDYISPGVAISPPMRKTKAKRTAMPDHLALESRSAVKIPHIAPYSTNKCGQWITPACLKALYGIPEATLNQPENVLGVFAYQDTYDQEDLDLYFSYFAPYVPNGTHPTLQSINGAEAPVSTKNGGVESVLDFDLSLSLVYPQEVTLYQTQATTTEENTWIREYGSFDFTLIVPSVYARPAVNKTALAAQPFLPFISALDGALCTAREKQSGADCGTIELTNVLSVSYGSSELQTPVRAAKRICAEFMKLSLKGHTLLLASQDEGVAQRPPFSILPSLPVTNGCINPEHINNLLVNGTVFNPTFPASCPFVTAVGATQLEPNETISDPERAMNVHNPALAPYPNLYTISSGGGVSNYFPLPRYQKSAVDNYFSKHAPGYPTYDFGQSVGANGGLHAIGGRGIPDISANGAHMTQFINGVFLESGQAGTSLSTPIVASIITLINQQRTLVGKGPVGFINPVIYKHPEAFTDITKGTNPGCGTQGFSATEGWDPITGLGTPIYSKLLEVFMSLP